MTVVLEEALPGGTRTGASMTEECRHVCHPSDETPPMQGSMQCVEECGGEDGVFCWQIEEA